MDMNEYIAVWLVRERSAQARASSRGGPIGSRELLRTRSGAGLGRFRPTRWGALVTGFFGHTRGGRSHGLMSQI